jgi:hypothetical protein
MTPRKLILLFLSTSILLYLLKQLPWYPIIHPDIWLVQLFFFCTFFIVVRINQIGLTRPTEQFYIFYFTSMLARFFLTIAFVFFMILRIEGQILTFVFNFIVMYLLYTWFEIYFLIHNLRADLKKGDASD